MIQASDEMPQELYQSQWNTARRLGQEFLKGKLVSFRWSEPPTKENLRKIFDEAQLVLENVIAGGTGAVKVSGVTWKFRDGFLELAVDDDKVCCLAHRMRCAGLAFHQRELLCSALLMPEVLCGIEVTDFNTAQQRKFRTAVGYAVWAKTDKARNQGLLSTLPVKGHTSDPRQALFVRRLNTFQIITKNDLETLTRIGDLVLATAKHRRYRGGGFVESLLHPFGRLELFLTPAVDPSKYKKRVDTSGSPLRTEATVWAHEAREAARSSVWRLIDEERARGVGAALGIACGINPKRTMEIYHKSDPRKKGILRKILLGGVWTRARLAHLPDTPCTEVCECGQDRETLQHLWWHCPMWDACRNEYAERIAALNLHDVCAATKELEIYVNLDPSKDVWIQDMMVRIFRNRHKDM